MKRLSLAATFLASALFAAGCGGGGGSVVSGTVNYGATKPADGDKMTISLTEGAKSYSAEPDATGKFEAKNVAAGTYTITVTMYSQATPKGPAAPPQTLDYPDKWAVPGGPFTLDVSKLSKKK